MPSLTLTVGWRIVFQYHKVNAGIFRDLPSPCGFKLGLATVPCLLSSKTVLGSGTIQCFWGKTGQLKKEGYVWCTKSIDICFVLGFLQGQFPVSFSPALYSGFTVTLP